MKHEYCKKIFSAVTGESFSVVFWDGAVVHYGLGEPEFSLRFVREPSLSDFSKPLSLFFGEAYMNGGLVLEGDFSAVARSLDKANLANFFNKGVCFFTQHIVPGLRSVGQTFYENNKKILPSITTLEMLFLSFGSIKKHARIPVPILNILTTPLIPLKKTKMSLF